MYHLTKPQIAVPVHGERRHLSEQAKLALECQVPKAIVVENGTLLKLGPGEAKITGEVYYGRLTLDGNRLVSIDSELIKGRMKALFNTSLIIPIHM